MKLVSLVNSKLKVILWLILAAIIYVPSSYYIPDTYLLEAVGTEVRRIDSTGSVTAADKSATTKDVYFARFKFVEDDNTLGGVFVSQNYDMKVMYLKWKSADIQAEIDGLARCPGNRVYVRFMGWRWQFMDMFPNVVSIVEVVDEGSCGTAQTTG